MKPLVILLAGLGLLSLVGAIGVDRALIAAKAAKGAKAAPGASTLPTGGLVTMWRLDALSNRLNLFTGGPGGVHQGNEVRNADTHLDFGNFGPGKDMLSVAVQGGDVGGIVDLGSEEQLHQRFGFAQPGGIGQGFASVRVEGGHLVIANGALGPEADEVLTAHAINAQASAALDHIYVLRIGHTDDPTFEMLVKFHVVDFTPGRSVTLRWERLSP